MKKKKLIIKFQVTNLNIKLRFDAEQKKDPEFTLIKMAELFGVIDLNGHPQRAVVWRWIQTEKYSRLPNFTYKCPDCGLTQHERVYNWINDLTLTKD